MPTTEGGFPHLTLAYTKRAAAVFDEERVVECATTAFKALENKQVDLVGVEIDSFEKDGKTRHCVTMTAAVPAEFGMLRKQLFLDPYEGQNLPVFMRPPHVTHGYFDTKEEAVQAATEVDRYLPLTVRIVGVTVD